MLLGYLQALNFICVNFFRYQNGSEGTARTTKKESIENRERGESCFFPAVFKGE
jgi:hypothetical protein